jgi:hypothetical protein
MSVAHVCVDGWAGPLVPSVLHYRILACWLPVFVGWPVMRWLTKNDMI